MILMHRSEALRHVNDRDLPQLGIMQHPVVPVATAHGKGGDALENGAWKKKVVLAGPAGWIAPPDGVFFELLLPGGALHADGLRHVQVDAFAS